MRRVVLIFIFFSSYLYAQVLETYADQVRIGFEIEFDRSGFLGLVDDFDMDFFQQHATSTDEQLEVLSRDYVRNHEVLYSLPENIQLELTRDVNFSTSPGIIELPTNPQDVNLTGFVTSNSPDTILSEADAWKLMKDKWSQLPFDIKKSYGNIPGLSNKIKMAFLDGVDLGVFYSADRGASVSMARSWKTIKDRWNAFPIEKRREFTKYSNLSKKLKAGFIFDNLEYVGSIDLNGKLEEGGVLRLRKDLTDEKKALYNRLEWFKDGGAVEFRHKTPYDNANDFLRSVERFTEGVGVADTINNPSVSSGNTGIHIHFSLKGKTISVDKIEDINKLYALEMITGRNNASSIFSTDGYVYFNEEIDKRGLVRLVENGDGTDRIELRAQYDSPRETIKNIISYIADPDGDANVARRISRLLNPSNINKLIEHDKFLLFVEYLEPGSLSTSQALKLNWSFMELAPLNERLSLLAAIEDTSDPNLLKKIEETVNTMKYSWQNASAAEKVKALETISKNYDDPKFVKILNDWRFDPSDIALLRDKLDLAKVNKEFVLDIVKYIRDVDPELQRYLLSFKDEIPVGREANYLEGLLRAKEPIPEFKDELLKFVQNNDVSNTPSFEKVIGKNLTRITLPELQEIIFAEALEDEIILETPKEDRLPEFSNQNTSSSLKCALKQML